MVHLDQRPTTHWPPAAPPQWNPLPPPAHVRSRRTGAWVVVGIAGSVVILLVAAMAYLAIQIAALTNPDLPLPASSTIPAPTHTAPIDSGRPNPNPVLRDDTAVPAGGHGYTLAPGSPIGQMNSAGTEGERCSVAFTGVLPNGSKYAVTAGHCVVERDTSNPLEDPATRDPLGRYRVWQQDPSAWTQPTDTFGFAVAELSPGVRISSSMTQGRMISGTATVQPGDRVCKLGATTGWTCGTVETVNDRQIDISIVGGGGDSGGPVVMERPNGTYALVGITISGAEGGETAQPIDALLDLVREHYDPSVSVR
jgi:hypothetical protein